MQTTEPQIASQGWVEDNVTKYYCVILFQEIKMFLLLNILSVRIYLFTSVSSQTTHNMIKYNKQTIVLILWRDYDVMIL